VGSHHPTGNAATWIKLVVNREQCPHSENTIRPFASKPAAPPAAPVSSSAAETSRRRTAGISRTSLICRAA
jgi:hypothetical protein